MSRYNRPISSAEQKLYDHLLYWIETESPPALIERFRTLFIEGVGYPDPEISQALRSVVSSDLACEDFRYVLNRCSHILINRWQSRPSSQLAIPALVHLFAELPALSSTAAQLRAVRRQRQLIKEFTATEQYLTLCRLSQVLAETELAHAGNRPLGTLIRHYPYLYEHCLLSEDSAQEQQSTVRQIQTTRQRQFEIHLSHYVTYQVRRSHLTPVAPAATQPQSPIRPVSNPTLLSDRDLGHALRHYIGKIDGSRTCKDLAHHFLVQAGEAPCFAAFKDDLYEYVTGAIDPAYGQRKFNNQLHSQLKNTLTDSNSQPLNDFLMVRTCSQLLNFLVADTPQQPSHFVFIDLITNLGPIVTTGLLLRIVLFCRRVKPYLERRFSILFNHYESHDREAVQWLVQALENMNLALTTNFGAVNLTLLR